MVVKCRFFEGIKKRADCTFRFKKMYGWFLGGYLPDTLKKYFVYESITLPTRKRV